MTVTDEAVDLQFAHSLLIDGSKIFIFTDILSNYLTAYNVDAYKFTTKYAAYKYSILLALLHNTPLSLHCLQGSCQSSYTFFDGCPVVVADDDTACLYTVNTPGI